MNNTEKEKIYILSLYNITVLDKGGMSYHIVYKNDKVFYNKINFKLLDTFVVVNCILSVFRLDKDLLFKERFLIDNNFTKNWTNSIFTLVKGKIKIPYLYLSYKEQKYDIFVETISNIFSKKIKEESTSMYGEIDNVLINYNKTKNEKNITINYDENLKIKKENIKRILIKNNMIVQ